MSPSPSHLSPVRRAAEPQAVASAPRTPLTVFHVCSIKGRGGTGYMASHLCRLLASRGHRVLFGACAGSVVEERARQDGLTLVPGLRLRRGFHPLDLFRDIAILRRCIRGHGVGIVHAWHSIEYWTCALALLGTRARLARTRGLVTPIPSHAANRWIHERTGALFATCRRIEDLYRAAGFQMENVFRLQDGVDLERFRPSGGDRRKIRREWGLPDDAFLVLNVGRLQPVKGHSTFLRAIAQAPAEVRGAIAGDGWLRDALLAEHRSLDLGERVRFLGMRDDMPDLLAAADAYVLTSVGSEGSSRATLEAMAAGVPVVTTNVGMLPDIVRSEETGLLVDPEDAAGLARCIERLRQDEGLRRRLARNALTLVQREHSETAMAECVEGVYRRILDGP